MTNLDYRWRSLRFAAVILAVVGNLAFGADTSLVVTEVDQNGSTSCRRPHNAGVHAANRTFICWAGPQMSPCVKVYDHDTKQWSKTFVISSYRSRDYHDYPTMIMGPDKYLHVFWTKHNKEIYHCRSPGPLVIEGAWTQTVLKSAGATYPCPMTGPDGELYLFYRGRGNPSRSHADYIKSEDKGKTWQTVSDAISTRLNGKLHGFYLQHVMPLPAYGDRPSCYQLAWSLRSSPRSPLINVYCARFYPGKDVFGSINGVDLGEAISEDEARQHCLVKETNAGWGLLSHATDDGRATVFYCLWNTPGQDICARWTGKEWQESSVPFRAKEIEKIGAQSFRIYSSTKGSLNSWESEDGAKTWKQSGSVALPVKRISQCILIDNFHPSVKLFLKQDDKWDPKHLDATDKILVVGNEHTGGEQPPAADSLNAAPEE